MDQDARQQDDPEHPQEAALRQERVSDLAEAVSIAVEGLLAREDFQVAVHVRDQIQHEDRTGGSHC